MQEQKFTEKNKCQVAVRLSKEDYCMIKKLVESGVFRNFADFLREATKDKLESMKIVSVKEVDDDTAEQMIGSYVSSHPGSIFVSEIADNLGLEYSVAFRIVHKMLKEGTVEKAT